VLMSSVVIDICIKLCKVAEATRDGLVWSALHNIQDCDCEDYCDKCSVILTLDATWEGKAAERHGYDKDRTIFITSLDLVSSDPRVTPVHFSQG
jgi:hypothetical protein